MSFDVSALPAYIEQEDFPDLMLKVQQQGRTASLIDSQVGVKDTSAMHFMTTDVIFQANGCSRTALGTTAFTNKSVSVGDIALHEDLCTKTLNGYWLQKKVGKGEEAEKMIPGEIEAGYVADKMARVGLAIEVADWQGDTGSGSANLNKYDGLIVNIDAGSPVNGNTAGITVATGITTANIIAILQDMYLAIPKEVLGQPDMTFFLGEDVFALYQMALVNLNAFNYASNENLMSTKLFGTNVAVEGVAGLNGTDRIFATQASNLLIIMDGDSDEDNWDIWYSKEDKINKFDLTFKRGTGVRFEEEVTEFTLVP